MDLTQFELDIVFCIRRSAQKILSGIYKVALEEEPTIDKKDAIQWMQRFKIVKPLGFHFTSVITIRKGVKKSPRQLDGIVAIFFPEDTAMLLPRAVGKPSKTDDDIINGCGEFSSAVSNLFKTELEDRGYQELDIAAPANFVGEISELFEYKGTKKLEITYRRNEEAFLKIELALDAQIFQKK